MGRKRKHEEHENLERWLISYADFITLLFAFFVVMYAISSVNEGKYRVLADTLTDAFNATPHALMPIEVGEEGIQGEPTLSQKDRTGNAPIRERTSGIDSLSQLKSDFEHALQYLIEDELIDVTQSPNWIEIEINSSLLFASGVAELEDEAVPILRRLAAILKKYPNAVQVEGFTDNLPISTFLFRSNWELSAARAASVVQVFAQDGVEDGRLSAIGHGANRPIADNATEKGRRKNRRVAIVILTNNKPRETLQRTRVSLEEG